jgi:hypothetical protein
MDRKARVLEDKDVSIGLNNQGIPCTPEDIHRHVQLLSPGLFQLTFDQNRTMMITVDPKVCCWFSFD